MTKLARVGVAIALFASAHLAMAAGHTAKTSPTSGTRVELKAIPTFVDRVLVPVLPGRENSFAIAGAAIDVVDAPAGFTLSRAANTLTIQAPAGEAHGYARVRVDGRNVTLTLVNLVPYDAMRDGRLDGYRVGEYRDQPLKGLATYERPKGFIRLTAANSDLWVSDHYRLRDFQCKLDGDSKFLILRPEALIKLELLQNELQTAHGLDFRRFTIMSGYRTPYYNARIGNDTSYSRHLYGDAMDIYIDEDGSGAMDDINRDGRVDARDAKFLLSVAEKIDQSETWGWLKGGGGVYKANSAHGPYVHVDTRGYVARWGV